MVCSSGKTTPHPLTSLAPMTSIKTISITAVSLAAGLCLLSVSGNAAQANPYNTFGDTDGCDSWSAGGFTPDIGGGFVSDHDCEDHHEWASDGAQRSQQHPPSPNTSARTVGLSVKSAMAAIGASNRRLHGPPLNLNSSGSSKKFSCSR